MSLRAAAKAFNIDKSTLSKRLRGFGEKIGHPTNLSDLREKIIAKMLSTCNDIGFSLNRNQPLNVVVVLVLLVLNLIHTCLIQTIFVVPIVRVGLKFVNI